MPAKVTIWHQTTRNLADIPRYFTVATTTQSLLALLFTLTSGMVAFLAAAKAGQVSAAETVSWLWGIYVLGGLLTMFMALVYRLPAAVVASIPGVAMAGHALQRFSFAEAAGAYVVAALLILVVGVLGLGQRFITLVPMPVILGMVAGVLARFVLALIDAFVQLPLAGAAIVLAYFLTPLLSRRVPAILMALIAAAVAAGVGGHFQWVALPVALGQPLWVLPQFSWAAVVELALPLAITVAVANHGQVYGLLTRVGYQPSINVFNVVAGVGSLIGACVGSHGSCFVAPGTALVSAPDSGPREGRYVVALGAGLLWFILGLGTPLLVALSTSLSAPIMAILGGLALMPIMQTACVGAFANSRSPGGLIAFLVTIAGISVAGIGAPFWALLAGTAVVWFSERQPEQQPVRKSEPA